MITLDYKIVDYNPSLAESFYTLNEEWISHFFTMEDVDRKVLCDPENQIIRKGGHILFAQTDNGDCVGTVALILKGDKVELSKMAVTASWRGQKVGQKLLESAINYFRKMPASNLYLETNSALKHAIYLYEKFGFEHKGKLCDSEYSRSDVYMEYRVPNRNLIREQAEVAE